VCCLAVHEAIAADGRCREPSTYGSVVGKKLHRVESVRQQGRAEYGRSVEGDHSSKGVCRVACV
jgi:hypothetical protein